MSSTLNGNLSSNGHGGGGAGDPGTGPRVIRGIARTGATSGEPGIDAVAGPAVDPTAGPGHEPGDDPSGQAGGQPALDPEAEPAGAELSDQLLGEPPVEEQPRRRWGRGLVSIIAAVALVSAGLVAWRGYEHRRPQDFAFPIHATSDGNGIQISSGRVKVEIYADFNSPRGKEFQASAVNAIDQLLAARTIALVYHPIAILDQSSNPPGYSTQAAVASACAADGGKFLDFVKATFALQPAQNGPGLPDDQLVQIGAWVGLIDPEFAHCVRHGKYRAWVAHATDVARGRGVIGTPTVLVAGRTIPAPTGDSLIAAVNAAK